MTDVAATTAPRAGSRTVRVPGASAAAALQAHWPEYLIEAAGLGTFMISAGLFSTLIFSPASPLAAWMTDPIVRRLVMGLAMGLTAIGIIYSRWGMRSGAHLNPAVTLTFWRLGKIEPWDAAFYMCAQFVGGAIGVALVALAVGAPFVDAPVHFAATLPGPAGVLPAWISEVLIAFVMMSMILIVTNTPAVHRFTGLLAGLLVASYITFESPVSGMSLNPARTFASALPAGLWDTLWLYFTAPTLGMLVASLVYTRVRGGEHVKCAKLHHENDERCIFRCGYAAEMRAQEADHV